MAETYIDMYQIQNFASSTFHYNPRFISYSIATPFFHILSLGQKPSNSYSEYISACMTIIIKLTYMKMKNLSYLVDG